MSNIRSWIAKPALLPLVLIALVVSMAVPLAVPPSTSGASSIAMTGSFYSQDFVIAAGSGVRGLDIYVKVSNTGICPHDHCASLILLTCSVCM